MNLETLQIVFGCAALVCAYLYYILPNKKKSKINKSNDEEEIYELMEKENIADGVVEEYFTKKEKIGKNKECVSHYIKLRCSGINKDYLISFYIWENEYGTHSIGDRIEIKLFKDNPDYNWWIESCEEIEK